MRIAFKSAFFLFFLIFYVDGLFSAHKVRQNTINVYDVVVYGGSSGGVMAAVRAARMGKSVILIEPTNHLGGMTTSGLGFVDANKPKLIGGLAYEYFHRVWQCYQNDSAWVWELKCEIPDQHGPYDPSLQAIWTLEPHVAENIFNQMVQEQTIVVLKKQRLNQIKGLVYRNRKIAALVLESGMKIRGRMYIDATYEGDLLAAANVSYIVGREPNALYNEKYNGVQYNISATSPLTRISPYKVPGDSTSGFLPNVYPVEVLQGEGDTLLQAYGYRLCLTNNLNNRVMVSKPRNYDEKDYEMVLRAAETDYPKDKFLKLSLLPNCKTDLNNAGPVSTDYIGMNWNWVTATYRQRERIAKQHETWQKGLIWTLQNHLRVPQVIREYFSPWGLAKDEFTDNNNWPYQLYVREARRMVSDVVITELTALGNEIVSDCIALATYNMDSHNVRYCATPQGTLITDGGLYAKIPKPFPISYQAIVPKRTECQNLLVPMCLSASHAAFGSIRMEPQFMMLGDSAATAACIALDLNVAVQDVPYNQLQQELLNNKQILALPNNWGK